MKIAGWVTVVTMAIMMVPDVAGAARIVSTTAEKTGRETTAVTDSSKVVDLDEVEGLDIEKYVNGKLFSKFRDEKLSPAEAERMEKYSAKYNNRVDRVETKYDLCEVILGVLKDQEAGQVPFSVSTSERVNLIAKML